MKPIDINNNTYISSSKEVNDKDPKFQVGDHVRKSNTKNHDTKTKEHQIQKLIYINDHLYVFNDIYGE